jgi:ankyrin repeat protein
MFPAPKKSEPLHQRYNGARAMLVQTLGIGPAEGKLAVRKILANGIAANEVLAVAVTVPGCGPLVDLLLDSGADLHATIPVEAPGYLVCDDGEADDLDSHPLLAAASHNSFDGVDALLKHGVSVNLPTVVTGVTALWNACEQSLLGMVVRLCEAGADVDVRKAETRNPPLSIAAQNGHEAICMELCARGANLHARRTGGMQPLSSALITRQVDITALLLRHGADASACFTDNGGGGVMVSMVLAQPCEKRKDTNVAKDDASIRALLKGHLNGKVRNELNSLSPAHGAAWKEALRLEVKAMCNAGV